MAVDDAFGYHELLHAAHIMACMWDDHIEGHGLLARDPELRAEAERIGKEVGGFYQTVARAIDSRRSLTEEPLLFGLAMFTPPEIELTPQQLKVFRKALGLSLPEMCDRLRIGRNSYGRWERGEPMSASMQRLVLEEVKRVGLDI